MATTTTMMTTTTSMVAATITAKMATTTAMMATTTAVKEPATAMKIIGRAGIDPLTVWYINCSRCSNVSRLRLATIVVTDPGCLEQ